MALLSGLQNYWELDEASGTRADKVGGITLTDNGTVGSTAGLGGTVADFVSANTEYLSSATFPYIGTPGTISFWACLNSGIASGQYRYPLAVGNDLLSTPTQFAMFAALCQTSPDYWFFGRINDGAEIHESYSPASHAAGTWYHYVLTHTTDMATWYLNTSAVGWTAHAQAAGMTNTPSATPTFLIGGGYYAYLWDGQVGKVGIWNRVLEAAEIATLYGSGTPPSYPFGEGATITPGSIWPTVTM